MRERIECAVLLSEQQKSFWPELASADYLGGRLVLQSVGSDLSAEAYESGGFLRDHAAFLRRFDACVLPVSASTLSWSRRLLSAGSSNCTTPVIAVADDLKAAAINDLMALGVADFVKRPVCYDELRARASRILLRHSHSAYETQSNKGGLFSVSEPLLTSHVEVRTHASGNTAVVQAPSVAKVSMSSCSANTSEQEICDTILHRTGLELDAYAVASASRSATSKESFRVAKGKVIERFERAYIAAALGRCSGNIAMAARAAQKHRRAFWALMRKYQIDASVFRTET